MSDKAYYKRYSVDRARGISRTSPAARVRGHVNALVEEHGVTLTSIAEAAGLPAQTVQLISTAAHERVQITVEQKLLSVTAESILDQGRPNGMVPRHGSVRRLRALLANGWRHEDLTRRLGTRSANIVNPGRCRNISRSTHLAVKALYEELWDQEGPAPAGARTRAAKSYRFAPPMAWDDDTMDRPAAQPDFGISAACTGPAAEGATKPADVLVENVEFLVNGGNDWAALTTRLQVNPDALDRRLHRKGRNDLIHRAKNMTELRSLSRA